jgi:hypothetical protein
VKRKPLWARAGFAASGPAETKFLRRFFQKAAAFFSEEPGTAARLSVSGIFRYPLVPAFSPLVIQGPADA